jgi:hypothetical protein
MINHITVEISYDNSKKQQRAYFNVKETGKKIKKKKKKHN